MVHACIHKIAIIGHAESTFLTTYKEPCGTSLAIEFLVMPVTSFLFNSPNTMLIACVVWLCLH